MRRVLLVLVLVVSAACGSDPPKLEIRVVTPPDHPEQTTVALAGMPSHYVPSRQEVSQAAWASAFRVVVIPDDQASATEVPPVAGSYAITADGVVFTPMFGLEPGVRYRATFDASKLSTAAAWKPDPVAATIFLPKRELPATTVVTRIYPSTEVVPENQLRLYIEFSAPMGRKGGLDYIHLLDQDEREVRRPFLPVEAEFWNANRTRYTVFFDPGRVKRGILPNEQMGRPLVSGQKYSIVIDREWKDGNGVPLREAFRKVFTAGPADLQPLDPAAWHITTPAAGTRSAVIVVFPEPLDYGLLQRALAVTTVDGRAVPGMSTILTDETKWVFTPDEPWKVGGYQLLVLTILEDMAGNRIGRAFEVDKFEQIPAAADQESVKIPLQIH